MKCSSFCASFTRTAPGPAATPPLTSIRHAPGPVLHRLAARYPLESKTNQRRESEDEWTVIPFPNQAQKPPVITSGTSLAILAASPEEQLASWLFIKWLVQPENLAELVKVDGGWPGSIAAVDLLGDYRDQNPQWSQSLAWIPIAEPAPREPAWRTIRKIYQDVTWQVFRTDTQAEQVPTYLEQADKTIPEVLNYTP